MKAGYELWLMTEAKKRNPDITLYGLPWAYVDAPCGLLHAVRGGAPRGSLHGWALHAGCSTEGRLQIVFILMLMYAQS